MKLKRYLFIWAFLMVFSLSGCGGESSNETETETQTESYIWVKQYRTSSVHELEDEELDESDNFFKQTKKYTVLGFRKDNNTIIDILSKGVENTAAGKTYSVTVEGKQFKIPPNEILLMY